jgi:two-component system alkaline phosphatase synthesis response regulator PhoP
MGAADEGRYLLVVDDNEEVRDLLALVLEEEGYRVRAVASGDEALRLVRQQRPELITLDLSLPGKDGWAVLRELQSDPSTVTIPVLIISAFTRHLEETLRGQVARVIPKPFYLNQIIAEVKATLDRDLDSSKGTASLGGSGAPLGRA